MKNKKPWSDNEIALLKTDETNKAIAAILGRTVKGVRGARHYIGIASPGGRRNRPGNRAEAPFKWLYTTLKRWLNHRGDPLSFEDFLTFTSVNKCHYCAINIVWRPYSRYLDSDKKFKRSSHAYFLDRRDNSLGYSKDNCVVCCTLCNKIKSNILSYDEMVILGVAIRQIQASRAALTSGKTGITPS